MASEILGLFTSPEDYQMRQQQGMQNRALQFAQLNPFEKASYGIYQGAGQLGQATGSLFGMEDPQLRKISMRQQMLTGAGGNPRIDLNDPGSMLRAAEVAQQFDPEFAQGLIVAANDLAKNMAEMRSKSATAAKTQAEIDRENQYRQAMAALPPDATEADRLAVISKFTSPDKTLSVLERSEDKKLARTAREQELADRAEQRRQELADKSAERSRELELTHERRLEELRQRGADAKELQKQRAADKREADAQRLADKRAADAQRLEDKREAKALADSLKPLPTVVAKAEDAEYEQATAAINLAKEADKYLSIIRSGEIKFGPLDRALISIRGAAGSEDAQVVARNDFERFRTRLINESLRLNKGTQTNDDAIRATNELKSAESMADAGKSIETLRRINADRAKDAEESIKRRRANNKLPPPETVIEIPKFDPQAFTDAEEKRILNDPKIPAGTIYINAKGQRMTKTQASR
jgi:hypothetical protein